MTAYQDYVEAYKAYKESQDRTAELWSKAMDLYLEWMKSTEDN